MRIDFAVLILGLVVLTCGCSPRGWTEPTSSVEFPQGIAEESVVGVWSSDGGDTVLDFREDGSFTLEVDMTVDMAQGGGIQQIQRSDTGRWTVKDGMIYLEHSGGLVLTYELVEEDKPDEVHMLVKGQRKPVVYLRQTTEEEQVEGEPPAPEPTP